MENNRNSFILRATSPPTAFTRADIVHPTRLQGFSDAVFATAATLLIIPVRKFELEEGQNLKEALEKKYPQFIVFVLAYQVICTIWEAHIIRQKVIEKVDDFLVALNLIYLMIVTFLPFTVELVGHYAGYPISVLLNCLVLLALQLCELAMFMYAFMNPRMLSTEFCQLEPVEKRVKKMQIYAKLLLNCSLFIFAAIFSFASSIISFVLICGILMAPLRNKLLVAVTKMICKCRNRNFKSSFEVLTGRIDKERLECFCDAAIAIVATLLILDLTAEDFPTQEEVASKGLVKVLGEMYPKFISYIGTYVTIAFLWFTHHAVLQHIKVFSPIMVIMNKVFLALLSFTPFLSTLSNMFSGTISDNSRLAINFSAIILFFGSFANVLLFIFSMNNAHEVLHDWAQPNIQGNKALIYLTLKILIIPVITFITFIASIFSDTASYWSFHVALFAAPIAFVGLKIAYACHWRQHRTPDASPVGSREGSILNVDAVNDISQASTNEGL